MKPSTARICLPAAACAAILLLAGCGQQTPRDVLREKLNRDRSTLLQIPAEAAGVSIKKGGGSNRSATGQFAATARMLEGVYELASEGDAMKTLGVKDTLEKEWRAAQRMEKQFAGTPQAPARSVSAQPGSRGVEMPRFYAPILKKGQQTVIAGEFSLARHGKAGWQVNWINITSRPVEGKPWVAESRLPADALKLDDSKTRDAVREIIQNRQAHIESVRLRYAGWIRDAAARAQSYADEAEKSAGEATQYEKTSAEQYSLASQFFVEGVAAQARLHADKAKQIAQAAAAAAAKANSKNALEDGADVDVSQAASEAARAATAAQATKNAMDKAGDEHIKEKRRREGLQKQKDNFNTHCAPGKEYRRTFRSASQNDVVFGDVKIEFLEYTNQDQSAARGTMAFNWGGASVRLPFTAEVNTREIRDIHVEGMVDASAISQILPSFEQTYGEVKNRREGERKLFHECVIHCARVNIQFNDPRGVRFHVETVTRENYRENRGMVELALPPDGIQGTWRQFALWRFSNEYKHIGDYSLTHNAVERRYEMAVRNKNNQLDEYAANEITQVGYDGNTLTFKAWSEMGRRGMLPCQARLRKVDANTLEGEFVSTGGRETFTIATRWIRIDNGNTGLPDGRAETGDTGGNGGSPPPPPPPPPPPVCKVCNGTNLMACTPCNETGQVTLRTTRIINGRRVATNRPGKCPKCGGEKKVRCTACAGRG